MRMQKTGWTDISGRLLYTLYRRAHTLTGTRDDAWDLVQDALERALRKWPDGIPADGAGPWFARVLRHRQIDRVRSCHFRSLAWADLDVLGAIPAPEPSQSPSGDDLGPRALDEALKQLPAMDRQILMLQVEGKSLIEIGALLGMNAATAAMRAHRARRRLRSVVCSGKRKTESIVRQAEQSE